MRITGGADEGDTGRATSSPRRRFWINTVSLDHVEAAIERGVHASRPWRQQAPQPTATG